MTKFTDWLSSNVTAGDSDFQLLADFVRANKEKWATAEDDKDTLTKLIADSYPQDENKVKELRQVFERAWAAWDGKKNQGAPHAFWVIDIGKGLSGFGNFVVRNAAGLIAIGLAAVFLWIVLPIFGTGTLAQLRDVSTARGSITFLFSLGTIFIALLLVTSALFGEGTDKNLREERFNRGKEVLTILIGILGTIVGFYFGTDSPETSRKQFSVSPATITDKAPPKPGATVGIATYIGGGVPPYTYTIDFPDDLGITDLTGRASNDGVVYQEVSIPASFGSEIEVSFDVKVIDNTDAEKRTTGKFVTAK